MLDPRLGASLYSAEPSGSDGVHVFRLDGSFPPSAGQAEVYAEVDPLVQSALDGYRVVI